MRGRRQCADPAVAYQLFCRSGISSPRLPELGSFSHQPIHTGMSHVSVEDFLRYASKRQNERLTTAGGRAWFTVRVLPRGIEITPESSRKPRLVQRDKIRAVLDQYQESRNLQPGQYQSISFDASYVLGILARYLKDESPAETER